MGVSGPRFLYDLEHYIQLLNFYVLSDVSRVQETQNNTCVFPALLLLCVCPWGQRHPPSCPDWHLSASPAAAFSPPGASAQSCTPVGSSPQVLWLPPCPHSPAPPPPRLLPVLLPRNLVRPKHPQPRLLSSCLCSQPDRYELMKALDPWQQSHFSNKRFPCLCSSLSFLQSRAC